jgi:hypothetical protein
MIIVDDFPHREPKIVKALIRPFDVVLAHDLNVPNIEIILSILLLKRFSLSVLLMFKRN